MSSKLNDVNNKQYAQYLVDFFDEYIQIAESKVRF